MLEPEQAVLAREHRRAGDLERVEPREQLLEHDAHLEPREVRAEAIVDALSEAEVRVRLAADVEAERLGEDALVAVRGHLPERHLVARADLLAAELDVAGGGAALVHARRGPAHDLLDRSRQ